MAKHYTYTNTRQNKVIFETVQPNHVSINDVDIMVLETTGSDPRLNPAVIERSIRSVSDGFSIPRKKKPKNR